MHILKGVGFKAAAVLLGVFAAVSLTVSPGQAGPFTCGEGNESLQFECSGEVLVDAATNIISLRFDTFIDSGSKIDSLGIQLPDGTLFDAATTDTLNPGYQSGAGNLSFDAEISCTGNCAGALGEGDTVFTLSFAYTGDDPTQESILAEANRTGSCDGFRGTLWGCFHAFRFDPQNGLTSQFVPLKAEDQVIPRPVPNAPALTLIGLAVIGAGHIVRRKLAK